MIGGSEDRRMIGGSNLDAVNMDRKCSILRNDGVVEIIMRVEWCCDGHGDDT
jgi:hypothetical protein